MRARKLVRVVPTHPCLRVARRGGAIAASLLSAYAVPSTTLPPVLVCVGETQSAYETIYPVTLLVPKVALTADTARAMFAGAVQLGTGQAVLDTVAAGLVDADQEHLVFVSARMDPSADAPDVLRQSARHAVSRALIEAISGRDPDDVAQLIASRDDVTHPFYKTLPGAN